MDKREPAAFLSYVRADDLHDDGNIIRICKRLSAEVRAQTGKPFDILVDREHIDWGKNWRAWIDESIDIAAVLIPVITPRYFESPACREELIKFLNHERQLGQKDLILPVYYIETTKLEDPALREEDPLAEELSRRQYADWRDLRFVPLNSEAVLKRIEHLARRMQAALQRGSEADTQAPMAKSDQARVTGSYRDRRHRPGPTLSRRRLGRELRLLREAAGFTIQRVADYLSWSPSKVSRMETGRVSAAQDDVNRLLDLYQVSGQRREGLLQLTKQARPKAAWWDAYGNLNVRTYISFEVAAESIRIYEPSHIPELLQTQDYARMSLRIVEPTLSTGDIERYVELRMARQSLLDSDDPPTLRVVLDEAPLRRLVASRALMWDQLGHLLEGAVRPKVTLQVLPFGLGEHGGSSNPFTILSFRDPADPDLVYIGHSAGDLYLEGVEEAQRHRSLFERLASAALTPDESLHFLSALRNTL